MSGDAALAFLVAGPATRIAPLMAMATIVRPLFVLGYVAFLVAFSVLTGLVCGSYRARTKASLGLSRSSCR